jgi:hypothetical protein
MPESITNISVVPVNDGVTTCLLGFLLVCLIFPSLVKNRPQYYAALGCVVVIILLHSFALMFKSAGFTVMTGVFTGVLQALAIVLVVLSVGGLRLRELAGDIKGSYEVMRRGETEKEVIIPMRSVPTRTMEEPPAVRSPDAPPVYTIDPETGQDKPAQPDWRDLSSDPRK